MLCSMKFALALAALLLICTTIEAVPTEKPAALTTAKPAQASKDVKDAIQKAKDAKKQGKNCPTVCPASYEPICAHDPTNASFKPRSFGNQCALDTHNCQIGAKLVMKSKGECPGSGGVQLQV